MILNILLIIVIGLAAYFHYIQGLFSAGLSAVIAVVAAVVAVGYHESLLGLVNKGGLNNQATAIALVCLFLGVYSVLRTAFDKLIPGNVRFPVIVDRVGAGALGAVAGLMAAGVLALAAQSLPFGPSVGGALRYDFNFDQDAVVRVSGRSSQMDAKYDALADPAHFVRNENVRGLWIPVDDMLLGLVSTVSAEGGSLGSGRPWRSVHPDFVQELFGQRLGRQLGSRHTALAGKTSVREAFVTAGPFTQTDPETAQLGDAQNATALGIRGGTKRKDALDKVKGPRKPVAGHVFVVVRAVLSRDDADQKTNAVSFGMANVRLVAPDTSTGDGGAPTDWKNHFPIGYLEVNRTLNVVHPDDWIFAEPDKPFDFVFEVPLRDVFQGGGGGGGAGGAGGAAAAAAATDLKFRDDVFFEFKRMARVDLSAVQVTQGGVNAIKAEPDLGVIRKGDTNLPQQPPPPPDTGTEEPSAPSTPTVNAPLAVVAPPRVTDEMPRPIGVAAGGDIFGGLPNWDGTYDLKGGLVQKLIIRLGNTAASIAQGANRVTRFDVPAGQRMVQVRMEPAGEDKRAFLDQFNRFSLNVGGQPVPPAGYFVDVNRGGQLFLIARYQENEPPGSLEANMTPGAVTLLFLVPAGSEVKSLDYDGQPMQQVNLKVE